MRPTYRWKLRSRSLVLGPRTLLMGIVNVTPDSFSDGGQFLLPERAIEHGLHLLDQGADILDIGGESTRPGKRQPVTTEEELRRVLPVIYAIRQARPDAVLSVDTYKAGVAREAVHAGADMVNDVSAGSWMPGMFAAIKELQCGYILMHTRGRPEEWRTLPMLKGDEVLACVLEGLRGHAAAAMAAGIERERIVLDPGFGFGKRFEENYPLLARLEELQTLGFPLLAGVSRKSFIGRTLARDGKDAAMDERLNGTIAAVVASVLKGAHIARAHDLAAVAQAVKIADAVLAAGAQDAKPTAQSHRPI